MLITCSDCPEPTLSVAVVKKRWLLDLVVGRVFGTSIAWPPLSRSCRLL